MSAKAQVGEGSSSGQAPDTETTPLLDHRDASLITPGESFGLEAEGGHEVSSRGASNSSAPSIFYYRLRILGFTVITLTLICFLSYIVLSDLDSSIDDVVTTNIDSIQLVGFSDKGIDCHIIGSVDVNYDNIVNHPIQKHFLKFTSYWLVGSVVISPVDPIKLFIKPDEVEDGEEQDFFEFVEVYSPDIKIDVNNHRTTPIDLITSSKLNPTNFFKYTKYFLNNVSKFELNANFHANFKTPLFTLNNYPINFYTYVDMDKEIDPQIEVKLIQVTRSEADVLIYRSSILIESDLPITLSLEPMYWVLSLKDSVGDFHDITRFVSEIINIEHHKPILLTVNGMVRDALNSQGVIILLIEEYLANESVEIYISSEGAALSWNLSDVGTKLPGWIVDLLRDIHFPLKLRHLPRPESFLDYFSYLNFSIGNTEIGTDPDNGDLVLSTELLVILDSSVFKTLDIDVPKFETDFDLLFGDDVVLTGNSKKSHTILLSKLGAKEVLANVSINSLTVSTRNEKILKKIIQSYFSGETDLNLISNINRLDIDLEVLPLLSSSKLKDLHVNGLPVDIPKIKGNGTSNLLTRHVKDLTVSNVLVVRSTPTTLDLELGFGLEIDTEFLIDLRVTLVNYNIYYQDHVIASFLLPEIDTIHSKVDIAPVKVSIYHDSDNEDGLQDLLSRFISGNTTNVSLDFKDGLVKIDGNQDLTRLLSNIDLHNVTVPNFDFKRDDDEVNIMSPFLIDATIYILKSEIEITIYNPVTNCNILAEIVSAEATYEGAELGYIGRQHMDVKPGLFVLPRIPFKTNQGIGSDILRKALNNQLDIEIKAIFEVKLKGQEFEQLQLMFRGSGLQTNIKL